MRIRNAKKQRGGSLIEIVVSLFMIGVLLVLYASSLNVVAMTRKLRYENIAYHIANKQMEALRSITYNNLPNSGTIVEPLLTEIPAGAGSFTVDDYPSYNNMKEIIVIVTWNDPNPKQFELRTLTGTGGINP